MADHRGYGSVPLLLIVVVPEVKELTVGVGMVACTGLRRGCWYGSMNIGGMNSGRPSPPIRTVQVEWWIRSWWVPHYAESRVMPRGVGLWCVVGVRG